MSKNKINYVGGDIKNLTNIRVLLLSDNLICTVPNEITHLVKLDTLNIKRNKIKFLPHKIDKMGDYSNIVHDIRPSTRLNRRKVADLEFIECALPALFIIFAIVNGLLELYLL